MENKIVEVILDGSPSLSLEGSKFNNIVKFRVDFSVSDLSKIDEYVVSLPSKIYKEEIILDFKDQIDVLNKYLEDGYKVRIWSSHYDVNSYLLLLYMCNYLKDKVNDIIVLYSDDYKFECYSPGAMTSSEMEQLTNYEHVLSKEDIFSFSQEWNNIKRDNADVRIIDNFRIKSVNYDYFNEEINNILSSNKNEISSILSNKYHLNETIFIYLIDEFMSKKI